MLPLKHPNHWRICGLLLLLAVLMLAMTPEVWQWGRRAGRHLLNDKTAHALTFAFLAIWYTGQYRRGRYLAVGAGLLLFGAMIEVFQSFVSYRSAEWGDVIANTIGIAIGLVVALALTGGWSLRVESWVLRRLERPVR